MSEVKIIKIIDKYVKENFDSESTGHDYYHAIRVKNTALKINKKEHANEFIVIIISLLHDVFDHKLYTGEESIQEEIIKLLKKLKVLNYFSKDDLNNILDSCENISYSKNKHHKKKLSLEGMIVQDADRLDAMGAIGIARTFAYGGKVGNIIYDPSNKNKKTTINHFYDKLLKLKDLMNTKEGKRIAKKRHKYMEKYLKEFYHECNP